MTMGVLKLRKLAFLHSLTHAHTHAHIRTPPVQRVEPLHVIWM